MSQFAVSELTVLVGDVVHRFNVLIHQHTVFATWCQNSSRVGMPLRTQAFMDECKLRGDRVTSVLHTKRIRLETPHLHWLETYKIVFKMHKIISTQQEMMAKVSVLVVSPERQIDILYYDREKVQARTAIFLLASSTSLLKTIRNTIQQRLGELVSIRTMHSGHAAPHADTTQVQKQIDAIESLTVSCDSALHKIDSLGLCIHANGMHEFTIRDSDAKRIKDETKHLHYDVASWIMSPAYAWVVPSNVILHRLPPHL